MMWGEQSYSARSSEQSYSMWGEQSYSDNHTLCCCPSEQSYSMWVSNLTQRGPSEQSYSMWGEQSYSARSK